MSGTPASTKIRKHIRSNAIGYVAVFIALTIAPAWASVTKNSVSSKHIKNGQVKSIDVANGGLTTTDINESTLGGTLGTLNGLKLASSTTEAGGIQFGSDTALYRESANNLITPDSLNVLGTATLGSGALTANANGTTQIVAGQSTGALEIGEIGETPAQIYGGTGTLTIDQGIVEILGGLSAQQGIEIPNGGIRLGFPPDGGVLTIGELTSAPSALDDTAQIFAIDNGSGKTRLMVQFDSGAALQLAIEP